MELSRVWARRAIVLSQRFKRVADLLQVPQRALLPDVIEAVSSYLGGWSNGFRTWGARGGWKTAEDARGRRRRSGGGAPTWKRKVASSMNEWYMPPDQDALAGELVDGDGELSALAAAGHVNAHVRRVDGARAATAIAEGGDLAGKQYDAGAGARGTLFAWLGGRAVMVSSQNSLCCSPANDKRVGATLPH